ncbi:MAG TPA: nuclear transport factor 2 family protein [Terriglobales bacterium]|nr:nuclear transport factor 2 family protein [Terriglobales bacterium]
MSGIAPMCIALGWTVAQNSPMFHRYQLIAGMFAAACLLLAAGVLAQSANDDTRSRENQLIALERLWNEAQVSRDANALARMIGDKFVNTEWDGEVSERGKFLADIADPRFKVNALNIQDVKVILYNDTAVVAGIYHTKGTYLGKPYEHVGRFTDTWVLQDARWQCVASHTSLLQK